MALRHYELEMRNVVAHSLQRGKVDVIVSMENLNGANTQVKLNMPALQAYKAQIDEAVKTLEIKEPFDWMSVLMRFPDVTVTDAEDENSPELHQAVITATDMAIEALMEYRRAEGRRLEEFFAPV